MLDQVKTLEIEVRELVESTVKVRNDLAMIQGADPYITVKDNLDALRKLQNTAKITLSHDSADYQALFEDIESGIRRIKGIKNEFDTIYPNILVQVNSMVAKHEKEVTRHLSAYRREPFSFVINENKLLFAPEKEDAPINWQDSLRAPQRRTWKKLKSYQNSLNQYFDQSGMNPDNSLRLLLTNDEDFVTAVDAGRLPLGEENWSFSHSTLD